MGKYFGTDGFRGEAGITLTSDHAYKVGRFLGWYYNMLRERNGDKNPARIVIGKDTRRSSYMFEYSLVAGLTASGADAYLLHVTTTPSVAYIARVDDFDCGIMITASHNPFYDNGIKVINEKGEKLEEDVISQIEDYLDGEEAVADYMFTYQQMMDASTTGTSYDVYLFAVDDVEEFGRFVDLRHRSDHSPVELDGSGVVIDEKLSELLDVSVGDTITLEGDQRVEAVVADITENYVYHYVYLTRDLYTQLYGEDYQNNVMLLAYQDGMGVDVSNQTSETLMKMDGVASYSYIATIRDSFEDSMDAINYAVVIIIVAAAALAFVVLYNLTNINITERRSELATLKVLGFYDGETTAYVLRENVFLTIFGVILGLVLGRFLHSWMVLTVEVDLVMFGRTAPPYAYVLAAALTALFSLIVNVAAHFRLKKIDMVESLKTVE